MVIIMQNYRIADFKDSTLTSVIQNDYPEIYKEMINEDYILEYDSFVEFRELIYNDNIVGFLTLDKFMPSEFLACLNECYILPEYRGKGILIKIIKELLEDENLRFYIRRPNYSFIKFLLKHGLALEVEPDIIFSHIKFIIKGEDIYSNKNIKRLYRKIDSDSKELIYYSAGFHIGLCSIFGVDPLTVIAKDNNTLMFTLPRKTDLKKYNPRKKLKSLTVYKINEIHYDFAINKDKIDEFNKKVSSKLNENNDDVLVIGHGDETLIFENLKPNDALRIDDAVEREFKKLNLYHSSFEIRFNYLLNHPENIDKTIDLDMNDEFEYCPFCGEYVDGDEYCKTCGQLVKPLSVKSMFKDLIKSRMFKS